MVAPLLAAAAPAATAFISGTAQGMIIQDVAADQMIKYASNGEWDRNDKSLQNMRAKIKKLVKARSVLNFPSKLERQNYCVSPLVQHLNCMSFGKGTVYVIYVPSGLGKTTAARVFLKCWSHKTSRGIAFCPRLQGMNVPYLEVIGDEFGIDKVNPPEGWLHCFFDTLTDIAEEALDTALYIILDDYMSSIISSADCNLLFAIKSLIRSSNVNVIVITQNKDAADHALTLNNWHSIIPLAEFDLVVEQREKPANERKFDWETHVNMGWDRGSLVEAAMLDVRNKKFATTEDEMRLKVDALLLPMSEERQKLLGRSDIPTLLHKNAEASARLPGGTRIAQEAEDDEDESSWVTCSDGQCTIL